MVTHIDSEKKQLFWVDGLKAFAIIGILLNHFIEGFGSYPWFSNPGYDWPDLNHRLLNLLPSQGPVYWKLIQFLGWLGDMGPGVFILLSGFTLTLSGFYKNQAQIKTIDFYMKRLVRLFPLYITIHFLVVLSGVILGTNVAELASPKLFLSMLALRFTDSLFFYVNPSWWFVWLILQLYIVFPFLFKILTKKGIGLFVFITLGFTLLSRLAGLLNLTYSSSLESWMTGIFFGTRLFEFALGMILAKLFFEGRFDPWKTDLNKLFFISTGIYLAGFLSSLFYPATLFSLIFITVGLSGIFLLFCRITDRYLPLFVKPLQWIGLAAFPVFLIHQPYMLWSGNHFEGAGKALVQGFVLIMAFPAGRITENLVNKVILFLPVVKRKFVIYSIILLLSTQILLNFGCFLTENTLIYRVDKMIFLINILFIPLYFLLGNKLNSGRINVFLPEFLIASIFFSFILQDNWFSIFWIFCILLMVVDFAVSFLIKEKLIRGIAAYTVVFLLFGTIEYWLKEDHPVEVNKWGEMPVLQQDPSTVYSLIPDRKTHLRYNNYDYVVKTNSLGFNGPEINLSKKDTGEIRILIIGDAFTMPEGMEYENAYPELLQSELRQKFQDKKITVINGGVTGFGPNEMYAQLKKNIDAIVPDIYINQLFINEFEEINLTKEQRLNSIGLVTLPQREKLCSGWQIPVQIKQRFHSLCKDEIYHSYTYSKSLVYLYNPRSDYYSADSLEKMNNYLKEVRSVCEQKNCRFFVLYAPGQLEISKPQYISYYPYQLNLTDPEKYSLDLPCSTFRKLCLEDQIPFLNPKETLMNHKLQPVYSSGAWHWNTEGHKVIAEFLTEELTTLYKFR